MARRNSNDDDPGVLIPISDIAVRARVHEVQVRNALDERDIFTEWEGTPSVQRATARRLYAELTAAREEYERVEGERRARQMEDEQEGRMRPFREWQKAVAADEGRVKGVEVSVPGDEKEWADGPSSEDES